MKSKSEHEKYDQYFMLLEFCSIQQWGRFYNLRLFHAKDKLNCFLKGWKGCSLNSIKHELPENYLIMKDKLLRDLREGIDKDIKQLEFTTEWDGYDSYSLKILASGYIDTFLVEAIKKMVAYLRYVYEKEYDDYYDQVQISKWAFVEEKIRLFELLNNSKASAEKRLSELKKSVKEINDWFSDKINGG